MDTLKLRLLIMFSPKTLALLILIAGGGFFLISQIGEAQVAGFSLHAPNMEPIEVMFKDRLAGRYSGLAWGWILTTCVFFWRYIGRQLKQAEKAIGRLR